MEGEKKSNQRKYVMQEQSRTSNSNADQQVLQMSRWIPTLQVCYISSPSLPGTISLFYCDFQEIISLFHCDFGCPPSNIGKSGRHLLLLTQFQLKHTLKSGLPRVTSKISGCSNTEIQAAEPDIGAKTH